MSNKFFCDICGNEINMSGGGGMYDEIKPNINHFKDPKSNPPMIKVHRDLCEDCNDKVNDFLEKRKTEINKEKKD
jgi:hypothetical protein